MHRLMLSGIVLIGGIAPIFFASETLSEAPSHRQCFLAGAICELDCEKKEYAAYCKLRCRGRENSCHDAVKYGEKSFKFDRCGGFGGRRDCLKEAACLARGGKNCIGKEPGGGKKEDKRGKPVVESDPIRPPIGPRDVVPADVPAKGPQSTGTWTPPTISQPPAGPVKDPIRTPPSPTGGLLSKPYGGKLLP